MSREDFLEQGPMDIVYIHTDPKIDKPMTLNFAKDESCMTATGQFSPSDKKWLLCKRSWIHTQHKSHNRKNLSCIEQMVQKKCPRSVFLVGRTLLVYTS